MIESMVRPISENSKEDKNPIDKSHAKRVSIEDTKENEKIPDEKPTRNHKNRLNCDSSIGD